MALPQGLGPTFWSVWDVPPGSVAESLGDGEAWIGGWDGVGLYEGNNKVPGGYQNMTVHITTHRILLVPESGAALQAPLSAVRQTEFYAGFMRSSAKITLTLGWAGSTPGPTSASAFAAASPSIADGPSNSSTSLVAPPRTSTPASEGASWTCGVCGFQNPLQHGTLVSPSSKCQLCGVAYATSRTMSPPPSRPTSAASSLPAPATTATARSSLSSAVPTPTTTPAPTAEAEAEEPPSDQIACPACTFLNHASMTACEICGTPLPKVRRRDREREREREREKEKEKAVVKKDDTVRLSFRRGGERDAYKRLKGVLSDKVWERVAAPKPLVERAGGGGIDAILKNMSLDAKAHEEGMQDAFRDLEVLMIRAGEMVRLAQSLNAKLTAAGGGSSEEEATLVRSSLVQLGLSAPALTQDMVRDERTYLDGLAKELGSLLTGLRGTEEGLMLQPGNGVVALDTVWGLWMRARGVALLPPSTLVSLLPLLPPHTNPAIRSMTLPSGLAVLYSPLYAPTTLARRLVHRMEPSEDEEEETGFSIIEIAAAEGLPIGLATEMLDMVASNQHGAAGIVRDEQASPADGGVRFYRDLIAGWPLGLVE